MDYARLVDDMKGCVCFENSYPLTPSTGVNNYAEAVLSLASGCKSGLSGLP